MIVAVIPAKGKSKRLKNKNLRKINKKILIEYSINYANKSKLIDQIYVSTDTKRVVNSIKDYKIKTIMRPVNLGGETPIIDVYRHAYKKIKNSKIKLIVGLQPDHPDRSLDMDKLIRKFIKKKYSHSESYNQKTKKKDGSYYLMSKKHIIKSDYSKPMRVYDNCTNIHNFKDLKFAEKKIKNET
tara:strand:- start:402 stop:953 length:552 start_codon:yes stop_codon:yes gene_type:complete